MIIFLFLISVWDYSYNFDFDITYDDNIFSYSSEYLDDFINSIRPYRFPFESHDDLISGVRLNFYLRNKFFAKKTTTLNLGTQLKHHLINYQKDYQEIEAGLRQSLGKFALKLSYQIIPNYLIRYYRDPQGTSTDYIGCEVKYQTILGKLSFKPKQNLSFAIQYKRKWDDYISEFDIYDASSHILNLDTDYDLTNRIQLALGYEFKSSRTDSMTNIETTTEPVPDGAYDQHTIRAGFGFLFKCLMPTRLTFKYGYYFRNYSTEFSADSMHFGRQDHRHQISIGNDFKIFSGMKIKISYLRQWRVTTSEILPSIDEIKDYNKYRLGIGLNFYY